MIKTSIEQVEYSNSQNGAEIHVFGRKEDGEAVHLTVTDFRPYFYAPAEYLDGKHVAYGMEVDKKTLYKSIYGESLRRIYVDKPKDVSYMRDRYHHYEADIPFTTRFMIDCGITGGVEAEDVVSDYRDLVPADVIAPARICIADIECSDEHGWPDAKKDPIICLTAWDSFDDHYTSWVLLPPETREMTAGSQMSIIGAVENINAPNRTTITFTDEHDMLSAFVAYIADKNPDILSGWNFTLFDLPYLLDRIRALKVNPDGLSRLGGFLSDRNDTIRGRVVFDMLAGYKKTQLQRKDSYRLDAIAETELGDRKIHFSEKISELWKNDTPKLVEYNWKDVELCVRIEQKTGTIAFFRELARTVGCPLDKAINSSSIIDIYILRKANGKFVLPSKGFTSDQKFEGATVFDPSKGLRSNVIVLDLKALYPMSMVTLNASPETKDPEGELRAPNGVRFRKHPDGITRSILTELLKGRDAKKAKRNEYPFGSPEYKTYDMQQNVLKVIMNTYYGVSGYTRFRLYDRDIGAATTSVGRAIIEHTKRVVESMGYKVIYGDSVAGDSLIKIYSNQEAKTVPISSLFTHVDYTSPDGREYCNLHVVHTDTIDSQGNARILNVPYVMRHKVNKKMYRVRLTNETYVDVTEDHSIFGMINTNKGCNKPIMERIVQVKPTEIGKVVKSVIVKKNSYTFDKPFGSEFPKEMFELIGYFVGDGSFNNIQKEKNYYGYLSCGNDQREVINKIFLPLKKCGLIRSYWQRENGDIAFNGPALRILNNVSRKDGKKIIPEFIFKSSKSNIRHFLRGVFSSDGTCIMRNGFPIVRYSSVSKKWCFEIQEILHLAGISSSVFRDNTPNSYNGIVSGTHNYIVNVKSIEMFSNTVGFIEDRKQVKIQDAINPQKKHFAHLDFDISAVQSVEEIEYSDYVYDIEVEHTHRFFANNVLVHNTDSTFVELGAGLNREETIRVAKDIEKALNASYQNFAETLNANEHHFSTKFEKIYERFFQGGKKKRYAGRLVWKEGKDVDEIDIVGFELKRSDSSPLTKNVQKYVMESILKSEGDPYEVIRKYLGDVITKYRRGDYSLDEIGIPGGISKDLKEYDGDDAHIRGARYANQYLGANFSRGSKPRRVYIKSVTEKYPRTDVICYEYADQVPPQFVPDYDLMLEKTIELPISRIIETLNWEWSSMDPGHRTLGDY